MEFTAHFVLRLWQNNFTTFEVFSLKHYCRFKEAYEREMDHFVDLILDPTTQCAVSRADVLLSTRVADACEQSRREGRMVDLKPIPQTA